MLRSVLTIILFTFVEQVSAEEALVKDGGNSEEFVDKLVDGSNSQLFNRAFKLLRLQHAHLDSTILEKPSHRAIHSHISWGHLQPLTAVAPFAHAQDRHPKSGAFHSHSDRYPLPVNSFSSDSGRIEEVLSSISRRDALVILGSSLWTLPANADNPTELQPASADKPTEPLSAIANNPTQPPSATDDLPTEMVAVPESVGNAFNERAEEEFERTPSGLLFVDIATGAGRTPQIGDKCAVSYTIYTVNGVPLEGSVHYFSFELGKGEAIPAIEEAVSSMKENGQRQLLVPPALGYPKDLEIGPFKEFPVGPKPATGTGLYMLNEMLQYEGGNENKRLWFNIKLYRVDKPGEKAGVEGKLSAIAGGVGNAKNSFGDYLQKKMSESDKEVSLA